MSPILNAPRDVAANVANSNPRPQDPNGLVVEAWAQGYLVGSIIIMAFITVANMRRGVLLHKLIFIELVAGIWQGFWLFFKPPVDTWWLSAAAIPLNFSWILHNFIAWMKIKPFLRPLWRKIFFWTVILSIPYWILEVYANFAYFHGINNIFKTSRPLELLFRDPWWIITTVYLFVVIKTQYEMSLPEIIRISPRFGVMLCAMVIAIVFVVCDVLSVTKVLQLSGVPGINPFWKFAFVFKCLTDSVILDDFKMALDRLRAFKISRLGSFSGDFSDRRTGDDGNLVEAWEKAERDAQGPVWEEAVVPQSNGGHVRPTSFPNYKPTLTPRSQKDSPVSPGQQPWRLSDLNLDPEDIVPSAIEDPHMRTMGAALHPSKKGHEWIEDVESQGARHLEMENDYAQALRDVTTSSNLPSSTKTTNFSRRTHT